MSHFLWVRSLGQLSWLLCSGSYKIAINDVHPLSCALIWKLDWEKICFQAHLACWKNSLSYHNETMGPRSGWLSAGFICRSHVIHDNWRSPAGPSHVDFFNMISYLIKPARRVSHSSLLRWGLI